MFYDHYYFDVLGVLEMKEKIDPYIIGLWLADRYWWGSSVGLSNTDERLIPRFTTESLTLQGGDGDL